MSNLRKDFIYKLLTNLFRIPVSFALQAIFPRLLGPSGYGVYDFLVDSTTKIISFFETGTSIAFYTNLSKENKNLKLIRFYWLLVLIISVLYIGFVLFTGVFKLHVYLWPNQRFYIIFLSAIFGIVTYYSNTTLKMLDAFNLTVLTEKFRILQLFISVILFSFFYFFQFKIEITTFFYAQIALLLFLFLGTIYLLQYSGYQVIPRFKLGKEDIKKYKKIFWNFSSPLFIYALVSLIAGFGDRWILQRYGGSIQQAYFGLSFKIGSFVFLVASAIMPLLMREFSKHFGNNEIEKLKTIYQKNIRILFFIGTFLAIFVSMNSNFITMVLAGSQYRDASSVIALMAFYPIHQSIGQINGTFYYSTARTREYRNVGMFIIPFGLALSYFFIAPVSCFGLNLGAIGLAYQMIIIQFINVNLMLYMNCKFLNIGFFPMLLFQIIILVVLGLTGFLIKLFLDHYFINQFAISIYFLALFSISSILFIYYKPSVCGFNSRVDLLSTCKLFIRF